MTIPTTFQQRFPRNTTSNTTTNPTMNRQPINQTERQVAIVGGYELQERLGSGSFATVYKGVKYNDQRTQAVETVAIKAISRTSDKLTPKVLENLELEISILQTYRHANIVCLHHVQKTSTHFNLILEYCAGGDVQRLIRSRRTRKLTERLSRRFMKCLTSGLKFLWKQELIHRDIKPQNLLLTGPLPLDETCDPAEDVNEERERERMNFPTDKFRLKIADFGFARHLQCSSLADTLCGSPLYMAPEILQHRRYDAKADLWSVGTVLFEMISGRPPFNGDNHIDLLRNIQQKSVRLPRDVKVSPEGIRLLRLLLDRNPVSRASFQSFVEASDAFVALGCNGPSTLEEDEGQVQGEKIKGDGGGIGDSCFTHKANLGPIKEVEESSHQQHHHHPQQMQSQLQLQQQQLPQQMQESCNIGASIATTATAAVTQQHQMQQPMQVSFNVEGSVATTATAAATHDHDHQQQMQESCNVEGSIATTATATLNTTKPQHHSANTNSSLPMQGIGSALMHHQRHQNQQPAMVSPSIDPLKAPPSPPPASLGHQHHQQQLSLSPTYNSSAVVHGHDGNNSIGYGSTIRKYSHFTPLAASPPTNYNYMTTFNRGIPHPLPLDLPTSSTIMNKNPVNAVSHHQQQTSTPPHSATSSQHLQQSPSQQHQQQLHPFYNKRSTTDSVSQNSDSDGGFVMVEHNGSVVSVSSSSPLRNNTPSSSGYTMATGTANASNTTTVRHLIPPPNMTKNYRTKVGILSTSPGTGGALVGMMGRSSKQPPELFYNDGNTGRMNNNATATTTTTAVGVGSTTNTGGAPSTTTTNSVMRKQEVLAKVLATAEDVGRRAVNVAHVGDTRAYLAMKSIVSFSTENDSSLLSSTSTSCCSSRGHIIPMEEVPEEEEEDESEEDDRDAAFGFATTGRARAVSVSTDRRSFTKTNSKSSIEEEEDEDEEMPFAMDSDDEVEEEENVNSTLLNSPKHSAKGGGGGDVKMNSTQEGSIHHGSGNNNSKVDHETSIEVHFNEALKCYLKALSMLKSAVNASQRVGKELRSILASSSPSTGSGGVTDSNTKNASLTHMASRCEVVCTWLAGQFKGVLERADAANNEINEIRSRGASGRRHSRSLYLTNSEATATTGTTNAPPSASATKVNESTVVSVEELIYNRFLTCGREGAVKQLLGQYEAARSLYRSAGLLAETLLMEEQLGEEDKRILEDHVQGFSDRIAEVDRVMFLQQQQQQQNASRMDFQSSYGGVGVGSSAVVGPIAKNRLELFEKE